MRSYDSRPITLDPGLTALALRALHERDGQYPFLDKRVRRKRGERGSSQRTGVGKESDRHSPYLLIVSREHAGLLKALTRALAGAPHVLQVISDRRTGERRRGPGSAANAEQRRGERRRRPPTAWQVLGLLVAPPRTRRTMTRRASPTTG